MMAGSFVSCRAVHFSYPGADQAVFSAFSGELPSGFVSLVGPNGAGKSTLMLLASGRLLPDKGTVLLSGRDTRLFVDEAERNTYASFIYQNMEFESEESLDVLLRQVYAHGHHALKGDTFFNETLEAMELGALGTRPLARLSKGETQRAFLAFAVLYGSRSLFMDEPIFAMEDRQKLRALEFLRSYRERTGVTIYISLHEMELTKKYAETALLFKMDRTIDIGPPELILNEAALEAAYGVPVAMLKQKEGLERRHLEELAALICKAAPDERS